jgi:uridine kinase
MMMSTNQEQPLVIAVAGPMGSGKTTLIIKLSEILKRAPRFWYPIDKGDLACPRSQPARLLF